MLLDGVEYRSRGPGGLIDWQSLPGPYLSRVPCSDREDWGRGSALFLI